MAMLHFTFTPSNVYHLRGSYVLSWIDIKHYFQSANVGFIDITENPSCLEIAFTDTNRALSGCWVSSIDSISKRATMQTYMPEGMYEAVVEIYCGNGIGDRKKYKIFSPRNWDGLDIEEIEC